MTEQQEQYTEIEKEAQKWLDETDTMQFSQMELLTMFAMERMYKNCNDWRVKLGVWLIRRTEL